MTRSSNDPIESRVRLRLTERKQKPAEDRGRQSDQRGTVPAEEGLRLGKQRDNGFRHFEAKRRSQIGQDVVAEKGVDDSDGRDQRCKAYRPADEEFGHGMGPGRSKADQ